MSTLISISQDDFFFEECFCVVCVMVKLYNFEYFLSVPFFLGLPAEVFKNLQFNSYSRDCRKIKK